jgi:8-oxo-dGTP diphosphatase
MTEDVVGLTMVVGFLFRERSVLLVQKETPKWQRGLLNGVGGKIEANESAREAMHREFREETQYPGVVPWRHFATEVEPTGAVVYFFSAIMDGLPTYWWPSHNDAGELLYWLHVSDLRSYGSVGNLSWLIPLALDWRELEPVTVKAIGDIREKAIW